MTDAVNVESGRSISGGPGNPPPLSLFSCLVVPLALLTILVINPPHALDLSISHLFFMEGWGWHQSDSFVFWTHTATKIITFSVALAMLARLALRWRKNRSLPRDLTTLREIYVLTAMACGAVLVWWLKRTTGVACPWDLSEFGGTFPLTNPSFSLFPQIGNCWPAGHAGTGFVFFAFYFALRDVSRPLARAAFWFALLFGSFCGFTRVMQGAHFVSHVIATGLIDWLVCAGVYSALLAWGRRKTFDSMSAYRQPWQWRAFPQRTLILFCALWWSAVYSLPYLQNSIGLNSAGFQWSASALLALTCLFGALFSACAAFLVGIVQLPTKICGTMLVILAALGSLFLTSAVVPAGPFHCLQAPLFFLASHLPVLLAVCHSTVGIRSWRLQPY